MQRHNTYQCVIFINHRQELNRGWRSLHLLHCFNRHSFCSYSSRVPVIICNVV
ncbi:hypothetical protein HanRHA438_Chr17g0802031 [Helianthus annuus]|nr:hypothetical protein HanIR_Chr17g0859291 [Helianthus annuus]KAJ0825327.1 hypothetical protein HanRHA438_Chr17g0802031 [Helianthus annuus]